MERIAGRAEVDAESFGLDADGNLSFEWSGYTEVFRDGQETEQNERGETLFLDADGRTWPAPDLVFSDDPDWSPI